MTDSLMILGGLRRVAVDLQRVFRRRTADWVAALEDLVEMWGNQKRPGPRIS